MASVIERFRDISKAGKIGSQSFDAQMKYDFLAAIRSMEEVEDVLKALETRSKKRESLRAKLIENAHATLKTLIELEEWKISDLDNALKVLNACRSEMLTMEAQSNAEKAIQKLVADGVSAGR